MSAQPSPPAVFFDLDGTLLDTAPDMVGALNELRAEEGVAAVEFSAARAHVSNGALGLLSMAFGELDDGMKARLHPRYLEIYAGRLARDTGLFPGMAEVLDTLDDRGHAWGVVTNKPAALTEPLLETLGLAHRCACIVSGDTLEHKKPHPGPLLHAAALAGVPAPSAWYVGDAARDIAAGRASGMVTVAALYGYIPPGEAPDAWGADHLIDTPGDLLAILVP